MFFINNIDIKNKVFTYKYYNTKGYICLYNKQFFTFIVL